MYYHMYYLHGFHILNFNIKTWYSKLTIMFTDRITKPINQLCNNKGEYYLLFI